MRNKRNHAFFHFPAKRNFRFDFNFRFRSENEGAPKIQHQLLLILSLPTEKRLWTRVTGLWSAAVRSYLRLSWTRALRTANTVYRKFETNIFAEMKLEGLSPNSYIPVSVIDLHSHDWSAYSAAGKQVDRSWEYICISLTETWMRKLGLRLRSFFFGSTFLCSGVSFTSLRQWQTIEFT